MNHQALNFTQSHVFIVVVNEKDAVQSLTENSLRLDAESEPVDRGLSRPISEFIDRMSFLVEPLHDTKRAPINGRAEETRNGGVAQVLGRNCQR